MASRRLDISSLLCDDDPPAISPLEALVHAATEEKKRLDAHPNIQHHNHHQHHQRQPWEDADPTPIELERRRRVHEQQRRDDHLRAQELEFHRQQELDRALRAQEVDRRIRVEEEERRLYQRHRDDLRQQREYEQRQRDELRQREEQQQRDVDRIRDRERQRDLAEHIHAEALARKQRELDRQRVDDLNRRQLDHHHQLHPQLHHPYLDFQPPPHPSSISNLISPPSPRRKSDTDQIHIPVHDLPIVTLSQDDPRPIKKRRFSESPTRHIDDDKERIARERDKMLVGELGYGRVDSPVAGPSSIPKRTSSGHGHSRKAVTVAELVDDRPPPCPEPRDRDSLRVVSPVGRRSPPGSHIGRAKAARKSDEHLHPRDLPPPPPLPKPKEEPKVKQDLKPLRPHNQDLRPKKHSKEHLKPPNPVSKAQHDDAHEWFLQQCDDSRPDPPPHSPSPSVSPVIIQPIAKIPSAPSHKSLAAPIDATAQLDQELEDLVSETSVKKQEPSVDMDLDVDLAVTELVDTLEVRDLKHESRAMEVDVEDELLSLVDDCARPPSSSARRPSGPAQGSAASTSVSHGLNAKQPPRPVSDVQLLSSPPILGPLSAVRQSSVRPTPERGSMPPPISVSASGKKGNERAGSAVPSAPSTSGKKKKETAAKSSKSKPAATSGTPAKSRAKPTAAKNKKAAAAEASISVSVPSTTSATPPSKLLKTSTVRKNGPSVSRSRSTSVMPPGRISVGPESDAVKAERQEEEEDSEGENEDDKLYCVCKTKYDEDRFMIACDRCDEWYHTQCVHMPDLEVDLVDQFICPLCIEKHPELNLRTTYKQRCLNGLHHPDPSSSKACHKAARGAFSKYCSDECGVKYMKSRIDVWESKGGKTEKLWESLKNAEKREGVVVCAIETETNGHANMDTTLDGGPIKYEIIPPSKSKVARETDRLNVILESVIKLREDIKSGMEIVVLRERLLELASNRGEIVSQCGWDERLCFDDEQWTELGASVFESYEDAKGDNVKEEEGEGEMAVDGSEESWWCPEEKVCSRHAGWQNLRSKDIGKEKELKEEALVKLTTREREIRKRIEDMLDPHNKTNPTPNSTAHTQPLKPSNTKSVNGHPKSKGGVDTLKKGKKRKAPV